MKIQTLKRKATGVQRECVGDLRKSSRNLHPKFHPMPRAREYQRAVTAAKMSRMFAQPLVGNFDNGHGDAVTCSAISRRALLPLVSGAADGSVRMFDLATRKCVMSWDGAHSRTVTGVCFGVSGRQQQHVYSCSDDGYVHCWNRPEERPVQSWRTAGSFKSIDHHWMDENFATASSSEDCGVQVWSPHRSTAIATFSTINSDDTIHVIRYHPAERNLLAHCAMDRGIGLHDTRTNQNLKKTILSMRSNDLQWNPMEPMNFVVGNEDYNAYTFDMRKLDRPTFIYKGHVGAVMSVAWAPTGREFVTGSYDRTIRIFSLSQPGKARDIYHTKRMQRVWTVQYSMDSQFIVSGSDDSNLRLWKAQASQQLGQLMTREEASQQYRQALIKKHQHMPQVRQIYTSRKIPKAIRNQTQQFRIQKESEQRKQANRVKYDKKESFVAERDKTVVKEIE